MNSFDAEIIKFVNSAAQQSRFWDLFIGHLTWNNLLKGGVFLALVWWGWFKDDKKDGNPRPAREHLLATLVAAVVSVGLARALAQLLPFRPRPFLNDELHFVRPYAYEGVLSLEKWSAFPSDHAALFFALAVGLLYVSRRAGIFALLYAAIFICFPRVYMGIHSPTDILAGSALGAAVAWIFNRSDSCRRVAAPALKILDKSPGIFYAGLFLITHQTTDLFEHLRAILSAAAKVLVGRIGG